MAFFGKPRFSRIAMKALGIAVAFVGGILGGLPAAVLTVADRSGGHGGDTFALLILLGIGMPGMGLGACLGFTLGGATRRAGLTVALGATAGAFLGLFGALVLHESIRTRVGLREADAATVGLLGGGMIGILLGVLMTGGKEFRKDQPDSPRESTQ